MVAAEERLAHAVEDLGRVARQGVLPKQDGEPVVRGVGPNLDRPPVATVGYFMDHGGLLGIGAVKRPAQR